MPHAALSPDMRQARNSLFPLIRYPLDHHLVVLLRYCVLSLEASDEVQREWVLGSGADTRLHESWLGKRSVVNSHTGRSSHTLQDSDNFQGLRRAEVRVNRDLSGEPLCMDCPLQAHLRADFVRPRFRHL